MPDNGETKASIEKLPAIGISLNVVLDPAAQRTLVLQTHVAQEDGEAKLNEVLDLIFRASDRQVDGYALVGLVKQRDEMAKNLTFAEMDMLSIKAGIEAAHQASGKKGPVKATGNSAQAEKQAEAHIKKMHESISVQDRQILALRARLGKE